MCGPGVEMWLDEEEDMKKKNSELSRDWNYEYGIFAKLRGVSGSNWNERQVKMYMDNNDIPYKKNDKMEQLVERLKWHEDKKYKG